MNLKSIEGIGPATEEKLDEAGITNVEQLADADAASLAEKTGVAEGRLEAFIDRARAANEAQAEAAAEPKLLSGGNPQVERATATPPCRPTSRPCRAGSATSGAASTRSSSATYPTCARP